MLHAFAVGSGVGGATCSPLWATGGTLTSSPAVADGVVYIGSTNLYAFALEP